MAQAFGIGVIGMGWMGEVHSRSYRSIPDRFAQSGLVPKLVVCCDPVEERARNAQQRFGFQRSTTDWRQVIADPEVKVVNVAAPNGMHLEINRAALQAGKHVLCEKPVGREPKETLESHAAARKAGTITFVRYNYRWAPLVQYARKLVGVRTRGKLTDYLERSPTGYPFCSIGFIACRFEQEQGAGTLVYFIS